MKTRSLIVYATVLGQSIRFIAECSALRCFVYYVVVINCTTNMCLPLSCSVQIAIFLFVEIIPICVSVRSGVLDHFSDKDVGQHNTHHARYQTLPQDPNSVILDTQHNVVRSAFLCFFVWYFMRLCTVQWEHEQSMFVDRSGVYNR